jgi:restriction endonuclease S subunit
MTEWVRLDSICHVAQGATLTRLRSDEGSPVKVLQIRNLNALELNGDIEEESLQIDLDGPYVLRTGQIVVSLRGVPIKASVVTQEQAGNVAGSNLAILTPHHEVEPYYLAGLFGTKYLNNFLGGLVGGTVIPSLSVRVLREFQVPLPPLEHQRAFAEAFRALDLYQRLVRELTALRTERLELQLATSLGAFNDR